MFIRCFESSLSIETVAGLPLILQLLLPFLLRVLCKMSVPSSSEKPSSSSFSTMLWFISSNWALTKAESASVRIISFDVRCPIIALIASIIILLPAPVSPVRTLRPFSKSIEVFSITAMFSIYKVLSISISPVK